MAQRPPSGPIIPLLQADPELGEDVPEDARSQAAELIRVRVFRVRKGPWQPQEIEPGTTGLLLLSGLMVRRLRLGTAISAEVVGPTDIIRP